MIQSFQDLFKMANTAAPKRVAIVCAEDEHVLEAVQEAVKKGVVLPIYIGDEAKIKTIVSSLKYEIDPSSIYPTTSPEEAAKLAVRMAREQDCDILMKGLIDTKIILKAIVDRETGIKENGLLSHVALVYSDVLQKMLVVSDIAMNINPNVSEKVQIIKNAIRVAKAIGYTHPKVGLASSVEKVNPKIASTVEAEELVKLYHQGFFEDAIVDGPFAIDGLVSKESAMIKGLQGEVAGNADVIIFPNLDCGNIFYKSLVFLANAKTAGIILGAQVPIVLTSRADSAESKLNSIGLAVALHEIEKSSH